MPVSFEILANTLDTALSRLKAIDWLSRVGEPEIESDIECIKVYLAALGRQSCVIRYVYNLNDVIAYTRFHFDPDWFQIEDNRRDQLFQSVKAAELEEFHRSLKDVIDPMAGHVMRSVERHLVSQDLQLQKVAAGCALEVCYQYSLECALQAESNGLFSKKLQVFEQGRWPLTGSDGQFIVY